MNKKRYSSFFVTTITILALVSSCRQNGNGQKEDEHNHEEIEEIHLSNTQVKGIGLEMDTLSMKMMGDVIKAHGQIAVPPKFNASVTTLLGGNIQTIKVQEGDKVSKGQVLATIIHPDIAKVQTEYLKAYGEMLFLKKEYDRESDLYKDNLSAGKTYQKAEKDYLAAKAVVSGYETQLKQLNLSPTHVRNGRISDHLVLTSPINGYVQDVSVHIGQFVDSQTPIFNIIDNSQLHADLMVYEKDIPHIKIGQTVRITLTADPDNVYTGKIESIGKSFEEDPKALHIHVELDKKSPIMMPKMYITGEIATSPKPVLALKDDAIIDSEGKSYIFSAVKEGDEICFKPIEVIKGQQSGGLTEIKILKDLPKGTLIVQNNAYYLIAEMKKGETAHEH